MKKSLRILNSKERKLILNSIEDQYGIKWKTSLTFLQNRKDKVYVIDSSFAELDLSQLKIDSMGNYFGTVHEDGFRLSIEGSQLIGPGAEKNVVLVSKELMRDWLKGKDLQFDSLEESGYVIIKFEKDFLGTGKVKGKEPIIMNFVPKTRRILSLD